MHLRSLALELFDWLIQAKARVLGWLQCSRKTVEAKLLPQLVQRLTVISSSDWSPWVPPMDWLLLISFVLCLTLRMKKVVGEQTWPQ